MGQACEKGKHNPAGQSMMRRMPNEHVWRETTDQGEKREVRATKFAGKWKLQSKLKGDPGWTYHDQPSPADLGALRDLIFRKYQRKRASYEDLQSVERMIVEMPK